MRVSWIRSGRRVAYERLPAHGAYFDWGFRQAEPAWHLLEIGPLWVSW